jgi:hypothetical protein
MRSPLFFPSYFIGYFGERKKQRLCPSPEFGSPEFGVRHMLSVVNKPDAGDLHVRFDERCLPEFGVTRNLVSDIC